MINNIQAADGSIPFISTKDRKRLGGRESPNLFVFHHASGFHNVLHPRLLCSRVLAGGTTGTQALRGRPPALVEPAKHGA